MDAGKTFYCAAGFREDVIEFFQRFKSLESHTYQDFVQVWNQMKFFRVFIGRSTRSELMEFCEEALDTSKELLLSSKELMEKICGLFLMYSIYFSMPLKGPKIRIILSEWENLIAFKKFLVDAKRWDCVMVFNKLVDGNAFAYCLCDNERGLENYYVLKDFMKGNSRPIESRKKKQELLSVFDEVIKEANNYTKLKESLSYKLGVHSSKVPMLFAEDTLKEIAETVKNLDELVKETSKGDTRRTSRTFCAKNEQDQDSDSNDEDPYQDQPESPESIDNFDIEADEPQEEEEEEEEMNIPDSEVPSTSKSDGINNDFDYLPHIKMEKIQYDSDEFSDEFSLEY